ncbi:hypothetical protein Enr13x_03100 [Stieleria neptunia]|uniref:Magnetosome protein MamS/MamX domain-containing protein n=1 Tax=Stieleria neptunia TaxID=2527979 RepID=A0A518HI28_9BACT|nr:hypothetical protein [Stieleria neptunia]QDV40504.1 hypothetical protein Enr13x_03100 [Stieleria neptunia]
MNTTKKRMIFSAALAAVFAIPVAGVRADEFGSNTPYYEDDAWYDVSEWFDGNDYNPTDEAIGRWDDEVFTFTDNATSTDSDNDRGLFYGDYGYNDGTDSDWFYDYYDDGYSYWGNRYFSHYYDTNDDGLYDAYASYTDTDGDGFYEDFNYYAFDSQSDGQDQSKEQAKNQQKELKSSKRSVSGNVAETKTVQVRDREHLVAMVNTKQGDTLAVDLGPTTEETSLTKGDQLTASGHPLQVGDKSILVATDASTNDGSVQIDRHGKKYKGTIEKTKTIDIRGVDHTLVKVKTSDGKTMMVDLGPAKNRQSKLSDGAEITVQGVPLKVNDRVVLMARKITQDGKSTEIHRRTPSSSNSTS